LSGLIRNTRHVYLGRQISERISDKRRRNHKTRFILTTKQETAESGEATADRSGGREEE